MTSLTWVKKKMSLLKKRFLVHYTFTTPMPGKSFVVTHRKPVHKTGSWLPICFEALSSLKNRLCFKELGIIISLEEITYVGNLLL
jgi:hypothetical protein